VKYSNSNNHKNENPNPNKPLGFFWVHMSGLLKMVLNSRNFFLLFYRDMAIQNIVENTENNKLIWMILEFLAQGN